MLGFIANLILVLLTANPERITIEFVVQDFMSFFCSTAKKYDCVRFFALFFHCVENARCHQSLERYLRKEWKRQYNKLVMIMHDHSIKVHITQTHCSLRIQKNHYLVKSRVFLSKLNPPNIKMINLLNNFESSSFTLHF